MIIGLSGYARSGKNTVADMLGKEYRQVSFAEPMREALLKLNPIVSSRTGTSYENGVATPIVEELRLEYLLRYITWNDAKDKYPEVRRLLQVLGTEVGREMFGQDFWVHMAIQGILPEDNVVFTDVRFFNEAYAIKNMGGEVWRINRPGIEAYNAHASETSLDNWKFDRIIENNGTLEDLRERIIA